MSIHALAAILCVVTCFLIKHPNAVAQELTPRAYWPAPEGTNAFALAYEYSTGDVVTDPSLPLTGVESKIHSIQFTYLRTFSLFGRTANIQCGIPFARGKSEGFAEEEPRNREISGLADVKIRSAINFRGAPTMDVAGFLELRAKPQTIVGASFMVRIPTGGYEPDKLINLGANRWAVKPALGVIWPFRPTWMLECELGAWFFGDNTDFLGVVREQAPILSGELHLVWRIGPGFWAALDVNYYRGGRTTVGEDLRADLQRNSRFGGTLLFPFKRRHAIRGSYSTGVVTESGSAYDKLSLSYQSVWQ